MSKVQVKENLVGRVFGRLTVLEQIEDYISPKGERKNRWKCLCTCGSIVEINGNSLKRKLTQSCGCFKNEKSLERLRELTQKYNVYELKDDYYVGYTFNTNAKFYFDIDDYELVKNYCWFEQISKKDNYHSLMAKDKDTGKHVLMAWIIKGKNYDHINRNPLDNRKNNLRPYFGSQNNMNSSKRKDNTSGIIGVNWDKTNDKWISRIQYNGKRIKLGFFTDKEEAIKARLEAESKYFKEFAPQQHLFEQYNIKLERSDEN